MATRTGLEPVFFGVTGRRDNQLHQRAKFKSMGGNFILSAFSGMAAVIALIDFEKCVYLEFRRLRVYSLIRSQLPGADSRTRTGTPIQALAPQASESTNSTISA